MTASVPVPYERSYWVVPGKLLAGCYPGDKSTEVAREKLEGMLRVGIRASVNLMEEGESSHQGEPVVPYEAPFQARGIKCARMPIRDEDIPSVAEMTEILDLTDQLIAAGSPTYVHCWGGKGRTGTAVGCWLVRHGIAQPDRAVEMIQSLQAHTHGTLAPSPENDLQRGFVAAWKAGQ
ncbi:MAG: hypothetical protein ABR573_08355 [Candidatus Dormibacteria bacterium]